ncbi:MAG: metallophosphoesterase [Homoserinimonas sp.]
MSDLGPTLATARLIGVLGDTHGDMHHLLIVSETMWKRGVSVLLVLGDFGFVWPGRNWHIDLDKISRRLAARDQVLYFVDGNHEGFDALHKFPISVDGLRWLRPNVAHIPRGYRTTLLSGRSFAALGGANSVDVGSRLVGSSWWAEESITETDLAALGAEHADVMVGHDAPLGVPTLDRYLMSTNHWWPEAGVAYSAVGRQLFHRGFLQVRPRLYLGGHYHLHIDDTVDYGAGAESFTCRVVILDMAEGHGCSHAVLDVSTLDLQFIAQGDATLAAPTGSEEKRTERLEDENE